MVTVMLDNLYNAAKKAKKAGIKPLKSRPVTNTLLLKVHDGHLLVVPFIWDKSERAMATIPVNARIEKEFSACVKSRPFTDWLSVTRSKQNSQVILKYENQTLKVKIDNAKAEFLCLNPEEWLP